MATDKSKETMKLALEALECTEYPQDHYDAITALREALAEQPAQQEPVSDTELINRGCHYQTELTKPAQQEPHVHAISGLTADELWLETGRLRSELADLKAQQQEPPAGCVVVSRAVLKTLGIDDAVIDTIARPAPQTAQQTIHCKHRRENNGVCPHHNLHCGWPKCNEPEQPAQQQSAERVEPVAVVSGYYGGQCVILPIDPARIFNSNTALYTSPPAQRKPLTDEQITEIAATPAAIPGSYVHSFARAIEAAHGIKENT